MKITPPPSMLRRSRPRERAAIYGRRITLGLALLRVAANAYTNASVGVRRRFDEGDRHLLGDPVSRSLDALVFAYGAGWSSPRRGSMVVTPTQNGDVLLVAAMADGDRNALARLYDRYASLLLAVGLRVLGERREAEDLLHDVFLEAWRQAKRYDPARGTVRTWLLLRMRSRCLDRRRTAGFSRSVSVAALEVQEPAAAATDSSLLPDHAVVRKALGALSPEQRRVLELGYFEGLSSAEIAEREDIPVGTVKSRVAAALAKLRAGLVEGGAA